MKKETALCMSCMQPLETDESGSCKNCGYIDGSPYISSYLAPKTFLAGRYIVGKLICYNGESALYHGYDVPEQRRVTIREYMPETLCVRERDAEVITVRSDCMPLYKTYLAEYVDLHSTLMRSGETPGIQTVLDVFSENNTAYAVMDYIVGISLKTYLSNCGETLSWEQMKDMFPPVLTTLGILHSKGIVHRAISPATLFVTDKMELKLIGFGISASRTSDSDIASEIFEGYAPPEQYSNARRNGSWTDVFGICAVLYRCLTGKTPPSATARLEEDTLVEPMMINRAVPVNISKVIVKGLKLETKDRIGTINELVDRLFELPQPVEDTMSEIHIPTKRAVSTENKPKAVKKAPPSSHRRNHGKKSKKKKKNNSTKAMAGLIATAAVIFIFVLAIAIPAVNGGNKPEATEKPEETTAVTTERTTAEVTTMPWDTTEPEITTPPIIGDTYILPDLRGRNYQTISTNSRYSYLIFEPTYEFSTEYGEGEIMLQEIEPNTPVASGTVLKVTVSKGVGQIPLPDYTDKSIELYRSELSALGVKYTVEKIETNDVKEGYVAKTSVEDGALVDIEAGETVIIYVATPVTETPTETSVEDTTPVEESGSGDEFIPEVNEWTLTQ